MGVCFNYSNKSLSHPSRFDIHTSDGFISNNFVNYMENYFKRFFGKKKKKFVYTTRELAKGSDNNGEMVRDVQIFHTIGDIVSTTQSSGIYVSSGIPGISVEVPNVPNLPSPKVERIAVKPIEVFDQIKKEDIIIDFSNLDEKIKVVQERLEVLSEHLSEEHLKDEYRALFYLKNRKRYAEGKFNFEWAMTNQDAMDDLCKRYKLKIVALKQYYTLVPKEGVAEIKRYTQEYKKITNDLPIFELIIKDDNTQSDEDKQQRKKNRDPILVANSPFGNFFFILGAWDDEVEVVDEIIYYGK